MFDSHTCDAYNKCCVRLGSDVQVAPQGSVIVPMSLLLHMRYLHACAHS